MILLRAIFGWLVARLALLSPAVQRKPSLVRLLGIFVSAGVIFALAPDRREVGFNPMLFALFAGTGMIAGIAIAARRRAPAAPPSEPLA